MYRFLPCHFKEALRDDGSSDDKDTENKPCFFDCGTTSSVKDIATVSPEKGLASPVSISCADEFILFPLRWSEEAVEV